MICSSSFSAGGGTAGSASAGSGAFSCRVPSESSPVGEASGNVCTRSSSSLSSAGVSGAWPLPCSSLLPVGCTGAGGVCPSSWSDRAKASRSGYTGKRRWRASSAGVDPVGAIITSCAYKSPLIPLSPSKSADRLSALLSVFTGKTSTMCLRPRLSCLKIASRMLCRASSEET